MKKSIENKQHSKTDSGSYYEYSKELRDILVDALTQDRSQKEHINKYVKEQLINTTIAFPPEKMLPILESFTNNSYGILEIWLEKKFFNDFVEKYKTNVINNKQFCEAFEIKKSIEQWARTGVSHRKWWIYDFFTERYEFLYCGDDSEIIEYMHQNSSDEIKSFLYDCKKIYIHCMLTYRAFLEWYKILINHVFTKKKVEKDKYLAFIEDLLSDTSKWRLSIRDYRVPNWDNVIAEGHIDSTFFNMVLYEDTQGLQTKPIETIKKKWDIEDPNGYQYVTIPDKSGIFLCGRPVNKHPTFGLCPTPHRVENKKDSRMSIWFSIVESSHFKEFIEKLYKEIYTNNDTFSHSE